MKPRIGLFFLLSTFSQLVTCPLLHSSSLEKLKESPRPLVEQPNPDPLSENLLYTHNQPSGVFSFRVARPHEPLRDVVVMADGKPDKHGRYGSLKDYAGSLDSLIQTIKERGTTLDRLMVNLADIDGVESRIREAAARSPEWKNRKPLKHPDIASYGDLVGKIILQDHVLREVEAALRKNGYRMSNIGMENLGLSKSLDTGEELPKLLSCAEISIEPLDK